MAGLLVFLVIVEMICAEALVLSYFWYWFLTPLGVAEIGFLHAVGISAMLGVASNKAVPKTDEEDAASRDPIKAAKALFNWHFALLTTFIVGWIAHSFM